MCSGAHTCVCVWTMFVAQYARKRRKEERRRSSALLGMLNNGANALFSRSNRKLNQGASGGRAGTSPRLDGLAPHVVGGGVGAEGFVAEAGPAGDVAFAAYAVDAVATGPGPAAAATGQRNPLLGAGGGGAASPKLDVIPSSGVGRGGEHGVGTGDHDHES